MSNNKALGKNYGALTIIQASNYLLPFLTLPFIVRAIGPERFGAINFSIAIVNYFILFINFGFDFTATRRVAQNREDKGMLDELFSQIFYARIILFLVSVVIFAGFYLTLPQMNRHPVVSIFIFASCLANVFTPNWLFQGLQVIHKTALFNFFAKLVFCLSIIFLIHQPDDYIWYAIMSASSQVVVGIMLFIYAYRKFDLKFRKVNMTSVFNLLREDKMVFIATLMISFYTTSNTVILGLMTTEREVGIFTAASRLIAVVQSVMLMPMSQALFPHIGKAFARGEEEGLNEVRKIFPLVMLYTFCMCIAAVIFAPIVVHILYGDKFQDSVWILRIIAVNPFIASITNVMGVQVLLNLRMDKIYFRVTLVGCIINIVLNLLFIPFWSYYGTAFAWLGTELSIMITLFLVLRSKKINLADPQYFSLAYLKKTGQQAYNTIRKK